MYINVLIGLLIRRFFVLTGILCLPFILQAQSLVVNGYVEDIQSGERLIGAQISILGQEIGTLTNSEGFFSLEIPSKFDSFLLATYWGYSPDTLRIQASNNEPLTISLNPSFTLDSVSIVAPVAGIGQLSLNMDRVKNLPTLIGEVDALRVFQLLPGVAGGNEGTSALYVRGGSPDQNLILLDDIPLYYVNHVGGFLSIFDPNTIKQMRLIKGGFSAKYGGRLSSVIEVYTKEGHQKELKGNYRFGMLAGGLTLEGPIGNGKTTFLLSARRSFVDAFTRIASQMSSTEDFSAGYFFYDLNAKITHRPTPKDVLSISFYQGKDRLFTRLDDKEVESFGVQDKFRFKTKTELNWGNTLAALRWQHLFNDHTHGKLVLGFTRFQYITNLEARKLNFETNNTEAFFQRGFQSNVQDFFAKLHINNYQGNHQLAFGGTATFHRFRPGSSSFQQIITAVDSIEQFTSNSVVPAIEGNIYLSDTWKVHPRLTLEGGIHAALYSVKEKAYPSIQPRLQIEWRPASRWVIHSSFTRMQQPLHLLTNSNSGLPTDIWVPATANVPPQISQQTVLGGMYSLDIAGSWFFSAEGFYKQLNQLIEFREGSSFFSGGTDWQNEIVKNGKGQIYGIEFLLEKRKGKLTGWLGYTLSKNMRQFAQIDEGEPFPYTYDRRHDLSLVMNYELNKKVSLSANWVFNSGRAITLSPGLVPSLATDWQCTQGGNECTPLFYGLQMGQVYVGRNNYRMPAYHRLDIGANFTKEIKGQKIRDGKRTWRIGLYNAYSRLNPYFLYIDANQQGELTLNKLSLFPILPSISYERSF